MNPKPHLPEEFGCPLNELDIRFSNHILTGWMEILISLVTACSLAGYMTWLPIQKNGLDFAASLTFGVVMLVITTATFIKLRKLMEWLGYPVTCTK